MMIVSYYFYRSNDEEDSWHQVINLYNTNISHWIGKRFTFALQAITRGKEEKYVQTERESTLVKNRHRYFVLMSKTTFVQNDWLIRFVL